MPSSKRPDDNINAQRDAFIEAARELGCDESEERFDAALRTIAKQKPGATPPVDEPPKTAGAKPSQQKE